MQIRPHLQELQQAWQLVRDANLQVGDRQAGWCARSPRFSLWLHGRHVPAAGAGLTCAPGCCILHVQPVDVSKPAQR